MTASPLQVLVIENAPTAPVGLFGDWLRDARGASLTQRHGPALRAEDPALARADLIVTLGSPKAAYDGDDWILRQRAILAEAIAAERAVIGICFGAQMIASAIGGASLPTGTFHRGWLSNVEAADPLWLGPWPRWHADHVLLPPGAEVLARAEDTIQAFRFRRALGVQFHPEAHAGCIAEWIAKSPEGALARAGIDAEALLAESRARVQAEAAARQALYAEMLRRVGI